MNKKSAKFALGRHMTIEYYDCNHNILLDSEKMEQIFLQAAEKSGATVIESTFHSFKPQGVSGIIVIAESHFSVHAWPEHNYAAVDIFTCGETIDFKIAIDYLTKFLEADESIISGDMNRGIVSNNGFEKMVPVCEDKQHNYTLSWEKKFNTSNAWGLLTSVDVYNCSKEKLRDAEMIKRFTIQLCDKIKMKRYGECEIVHFGEDDRVSGFSMTQLIETSLISGHFANQSNTAYLDIFSCKFYEPRDVAEFAIEFFNGSNYKMQVALRK